MSPRRLLLPALALPAALLAAPRAARADHDNAPPITDRDFAIDAYQGAAIASYRVVGMGGVALATGEGALGMVVNPASVAARPATANDWFEWDFTLDGYNPGLGDDYDNNGDPQDALDLGTGATNAGLLGVFGAWGIGFSVQDETRLFTVDTGASAKLDASVGRLTLARAFADAEWIVGASLVVGTFTVELPGAGAGASVTRLVSADEASLEAGALWRPAGGDLRVGARARLPISARLESPGCDPEACFGYILPRRVVFPWSAAAGVAWRLGPTAWNRAVAADFRDEKAVVVAADLIVTGGVDDGAGLEGFLDKKLQASGRHTVVSLRGGAEYEWVPGWLRVRGGSYWEPARFDGVPGRLHVTVGLDARFWSFGLWGDRYRLRLSIAADAARDFGNSMVSLGFWH